MNRVTFLSGGAAASTLSLLATLAGCTEAPGSDSRGPTDTTARSVVERIQSGYRATMPALERGVESSFPLVADSVAERFASVTGGLFVAIASWIRWLCSFTTQ